MSTISKRRMHAIHVHVEYNFRLAAICRLLPPLPGPNVTYFFAATACLTLSVVLAGGVRLLIGSSGTMTSSKSSCEMTLMVYASERSQWKETREIHLGDISHMPITSVHIAAPVSVFLIR